MRFLIWPDERPGFLCGLVVALGHKLEINRACMYGA